MMILTIIGAVDLEKELIQIANRFAPAFLAVFQIQRNQIAIRCFDIKRIAQNAYAAIADVDRRPDVTPDFAPRARQSPRRGRVP